jgi:lipopolysaccharide biosynthesis glycosyltransferase
MQIHGTSSASDSVKTELYDSSATHICLCFDGYINKQVLLTAFSAATAAQGALVVHFVYPQNAAQKFRSDLDTLTARLQTRQTQLFTAELHIVTDEAFDALPSIGWLPKASCLRLLISSYLPPEISRIIYLDSDIMVTADLGELYRMDLHGYPIAAVQDDGMRQYYCDPIGLNAHHYFNAGVLLIDLAQWDVLAKQALVLFAKNGTIYPCLDQDVLNIVLKDNWLELKSHWNATAKRQPFASRWFELIWPDGWKNEKLPPAVYHMTPFKPWCLCCTSRIRFAYRRLAQELFDGGIPITGGAPLIINAVSWLPQPVYHLMRLLWDANLALKQFIRQRIRR